MWLWSPSQNPLLSYPPFLSWWWCETVTCPCDEVKVGERLRHGAHRRLLLTFPWYIRRRIVCFCRRWTTDKWSLGRRNHGWRGGRCIDCGKEREKRLLFPQSSGSATSVTVNFRRKNCEFHCLLSRVRTVLCVGRTRLTFSPFSFMTDFLAFMHNSRSF